MSQQQPSEEELRAHLEEELKKITVEDVLLQTMVTLINLAGQRLGLTEDTRDARDLGQARVAIEAVRALMPLIEERGEIVAPLRDALAQVQLAYAQEAGTPAAPAPGQEGVAGGRAGGQTPGVGRTEGAQEKRSSAGGLWVPPGSST